MEVRFLDPAVEELNDIIHKCLLLRFPYKILYAVESGTIVVLAIAHSHRKPDYWLDRVK